PYPSLGTVTALIVHYPQEFGEPHTPGGYTTPQWRGYTTQPIKPTINTYTVSFDSAGGSTVAAVTAEHGNTITAPAKPTRDGYEFTGWYSDSATTARFDFATPVTAEMTLYAGWKAVPIPGTPQSADGDDRLPATGGSFLPGLGMAGLAAVFAGIVLLTLRRAARTQQTRP
ncbi:InlB B-repeat-containing protein, partial [Leucobacter komagatae]